VQPPPSCTHPWADLQLDRPGPLARLRALPFLQRGASLLPSTHLRSAAAAQRKIRTSQTHQLGRCPTRCWNGCKMVRRDLAEWVTTALINRLLPPTEEMRCCPLKHTWLAWRCLPVVTVLKTQCTPHPGTQGGLLEIHCCFHDQTTLVHRTPSHSSSNHCIAMCTSCSLRPSDPAD